MISKRQQLSVRGMLHEYLMLHCWDIPAEGIVKQPHPLLGRNESKP